MGESVVRFNKTLAVAMTAALLGSTATYAVCQPDTKPLSAFANLFGDIDNDGDVNAGDAALILMYAAWKGAGNAGDLAYYVASTGKETPAETTPTETTVTETTPSDNGLTNENKTLTILCWTDADLANMFDVYQNADPSVKVVYKNCGNYGSEASERYATYLNSGSDVDLYVAESSWIQKYINDDSYSAPLSDLGITEADYANAYDYTVQIGTNDKGVLKAASWQTAAGCYAYNTTLAKEYLGVDTPVDMQAKISDWDKFEKTAAELYQASDGSVAITATLGGMLQAFTYAEDNIWVKNGTLQFDTARRFSNMAKRFAANGYVNPKIQQWTTDWSDAGKYSKALGYFYASWCLGDGAQLEQNGGTDGNWRIVRGPQDFFWGGSWLCVSPNCNTKAEAANFLRSFTCDASTMKEYALYSGDMVNNKKVMDAIVAEGSNSNALLGGQDQFAVLKEVADGTRVSKNRTIYDDTLRSEFFNVLHDDIWSSTYDTLTDYEKRALAAIPELTSSGVAAMAGDEGASDPQSSGYVWMTGLPKKFSYYYGDIIGTGLFNNHYKQISFYSVSEDGSFSGSDYDSYADESGVGYSSTTYSSSFSGVFGKAEKIDDYTYRTHIQSVTYSRVGESEVSGSTKFVYGKSSSLENAGDIYIYLPGKLVSSIPAAFMKTKETEALANCTVMPENTYGIYFEGTREGLIGIK